jgi:hypothetical protein
MHARTDLVDKDRKKNVPGPGTYDLQNSPGGKATRAAAYSMGSGSRVDLANTKMTKFIPAPGHYSTMVDFKRSAPRYGFSKEVRPEMAKTGKFSVPAPGTYNAKEIIGKEAPSLTMSPLYHDKFKERNDRLVPGPGTYTTSKSGLKTAPNYGFGTSQRASPNIGTKGVNTEIKYDPEASTVKTRSPNYRFGSDKRKMYDDRHAKFVPAPGHYMTKSAAFDEKSRFYMGIKLSDQKTLVVPGSGTYDPNDSFAKKAGASYSMGLKLRGSLEQQTNTNVPGPGNYGQDTQTLKPSAPKFGFGTSKRPDITGGKKM